MRSYVLLCNLQASGDLARCYVPGSRLIGNIFARRLDLYDRPEPCEAEWCPCPDTWQFERRE